MSQGFHDFSKTEIRLQRREHRKDELSIKRRNKLRRKGNSDRLVYSTWRNPCVFGDLIDNTTGRYLKEDVCNDY